MECWSTLTAEPFYAFMGFVTERSIEVTLRPNIGFSSLRMRLMMVARPASSF